MIDLRFIQIEIRIVLICYQIQFADFDINFFSVVNVVDMVSGPLAAGDHSDHDNYIAKR